MSCLIKHIRFILGSIWAHNWVFSMISIHGMIGYGEPSLKMHVGSSGAHSISMRIFTHTRSTQLYFTFFFFIKIAMGSNNKQKWWLWWHRECWGWSQTIVHEMVCVGNVVFVLNCSNDTVYNHFKIYRPVNLQN